MSFIPNQTVKKTAQTAAFTFVVPKGFSIQQIIITNTTGNAITGGLKIGTTLAGTEVVATIAVGANALISPLASILLLNYFSASVDTTLYVDAVAAWNSASIDMNVELKQVAVGIPA